MYNSEEKAILFIIKAFKGKKDKITKLDMSALPLLVGLTIKKITNDKDIIIASYLHNVINYTSYGYEEIEATFNKNIADIVEEISEDWSLAKWLERKKDYLKRINEISDSRYLNIIIAEKTQELLSYKNAYIKRADKIWKDLNVSKSEITWFYRQIYHICLNKETNNELLYRYKQEIIYYFGDVS